MCERWNELRLRGAASMQTSMALCASGIIVIWVHQCYHSTRFNTIPGRMEEIEKCPLTFRRPLWLNWLECQTVELGGRFWWSKSLIFSGFQWESLTKDSVNPFYSQPIHWRGIPVNLLPPNPSHCLFRFFPASPRHQSTFKCCLSIFVSLFFAQ